MYKMSCIHDLRVLPIVDNQGLMRTKKYETLVLYTFFDRPGEAGAVLQTAS